MLIDFANLIIKHFFYCLQTILLGDSGVGKTSLLVQFDTGSFQTGNFAATVGIGFTVNLSVFCIQTLTCNIYKYINGAIYIFFMVTFYYYENNCILIYKKILLFCY